MPGPPFDAGYAVDDEGLEVLLEHVKPSSQVLELGSGRSTLALARRVSPGKGLVVSLEEDEAQASLVRSLVRLDALEDASLVIDAPLEGGFYARRSYEASLLAASFDVLFVDGPCTPKGGDRSVALERLDLYLAPKAIVVVHDALREEEVRFIAAWKARGWLSSVYKSGRGTAVLRRVP